ncbi:40S ribosomal protein S3-3-like [Iris pallida]|uniref:rhomboid protease n=1 Tax=Iris pallida TaxID=29817 RepID=A0AAX6HKP0_IRIPA|nr:40S ribosomal protein S3-3-like [Iris pallida]
MAEILRLQKLGALEWDKVVHQHQAWRLVTCIWLHAGVKNEGVVNTGGVDMLRTDLLCIFWFY